MDSQLPATVSLRSLLPMAQCLSGHEIFVADATDHHTLIRPRTLFAVIPGTQHQGSDFVAAAVSRGAAALLVEREVPGCNLPQLVVPNVRHAYAQVCTALYHHPSHRLRVVGVTGTNGKTTVAWMIRRLLQYSGHSAGLLGTVEYSDGVETTPATLTTPGSGVLNRWLHRMTQRGVTAAAIELSSHALDQHRAAGLQLAVGVITNVTHDHFDYHGDFDSYVAAKAKIVELLPNGHPLLVNGDDPGALLAARLAPPATEILSFGLGRNHDFGAELIEESLVGTRFRLNIAGASAVCSSQLIGRHNLSNALAAAGTCHRLGLGVHEIAAGLETFHGAPGRLERINLGQPYAVFVDYAHTPDALERCLETLQSVCPGRLIVVFGAGGNRDRGKRPLMGRASEAASLAVVTSDNPRHEPPQHIIDEILAGRTDLKRIHVEADRGRAIHFAISAATPGDCVLIAGKGHEQEQVIGHERRPFDDRSVARAAIVHHITSDRGRGRRAA